MPLLSIIFIITIMACSIGSQTAAQVRIDPSIVAERPCRFTSFAEQSEFTKRFYPKDEYETAKNNKAIECLKIQYMSDGLKVVGFIVKPHNSHRTRYPVIIYNRGGLLDIGKIDMSNILDFYQLASNGFVVLASQYRGNDGGEGREEFGGADVDDVINLLTIATALPYVDPKNIFFYGVSRGGMMTFLALRKGAMVNAVAVVGALFDLEDALEPTKLRAPGIVKLVTELIPHYADRPSAAFEERSAMKWPEKLDVPLLIIHGGEDEEVPLTQALTFATKLNALHKPYELIVYGNDVHEAANNRKDRDARVVGWFRRFLR